MLFGRGAPPAFGILGFVAPADLDAVLAAGADAAFVDDLADDDFCFAAGASADFPAAAFVAGPLDAAAFAFAARGLADGAAFAAGVGEAAGFAAVTLGEVAPAFFAPAAGFAVAVFDAAGFLPAGFAAFEPDPEPFAFLAAGFAPVARVDFAICPSSCPRWRRGRHLSCSDLR